MAMSHWQYTAQAAEHNPGSRAGPPAHITDNTEGKHNLSETKNVLPHTRTVQKVTFFLYFLNRTARI